MNNLGVHTPLGRAFRSLGLPEPLLSFRIYPYGRAKRKYFDVDIFRTWHQLSRMHQHYWPYKSEHAVWGFVSPDSYGPKIGTVCFYQKTVTDNVVAHEIYHATMLLAQKMKPDRVVGWESSTHEQLAEAHGSMVSEFWRKYTQAGYERTECWGWPVHAGTKERYAR